MATTRSRIKKILYTHREVAARCSIDTETMREWVDKGAWPLPHALIERTQFYKASIIDHWLDTGAWPDDAVFKAGEGRGRVITP